MDKEKRKVIMIDMDGTMTHSDWRNHLAPKSGGSWDAFHKDCDKDTPTKLVTIIRMLSEYFDIVISTARPASVRQKTEIWLRGQCVNYSKILMRSPEQEGISSVALKLGHKNLIGFSGLEVAFIIDDRKDVCEAFLAEGTAAWHYNDINPAAPDIHVAKTPDSEMKKSAEFFNNRDSEYGSAWLQHGEIMAKNFPNGVTLKTPEDFLFMHFLVMDVVKTTRICFALARGEHHEDSWKDKIVYSAMAKSQIKG